MILKFTPDAIWIVIGFIGQILFFTRFLAQEIVSEKEDVSIFSQSFWYFSIGDGLFLFADALYRHGPIFILGQSRGLFIYARNIFLIRHQAAYASVVR